jgi:hypothetical protein
MPVPHDPNRDLHALYRRRRRDNPASWFIAFAVAVVIVCAVVLGYRVTKIASSGEPPITSGQGTHPSTAPAEPAPAQR